MMIGLLSCVKQLTTRFLLANIGGLMTCRLLFSILALLLLLFCVGCKSTGLSPGARTTADRALVSLRKIDAAAESDLTETPKEYRVRLIEARSEVEQALTNLPEGDLKKELGGALEVCLDRAKILEYAWAGPLLPRIGGSGYSPNSSFDLNTDREEDKVLIERLTKSYGVPFYNDKYGIYKDDRKYNRVRFGSYDTLEALKKSGRTRIDRVASLLTEEGR
jgi:hypothetical protein